MNDAAINRTPDYNTKVEELYRWRGLNQGIEATFQVTTDCNLRCSYCYQGNKHPGFMSLETGKKFIDVLFRDLQDKKGFVILDFIGGEPFLATDLISDLVDYWYYKCIEEENWLWGALTRVSICSNGVLYDDPKVQKLIHKLGDSLSFTVSIDGNKELHDSARLFPDGRGSYDAAIHAAESYEKRSGTQLGSKMTIAPNNIIFLYPAIKHYLESGKQEIFANTVYENVWTLDHAKLFYKELKRLADYKIENYPGVYLSLFDNNLFRRQATADDQPFCGGFSGDGKTPTMIACDYDGQIFPCQRYTEICIPRDEQPPLTIGDVDHGIDFEKIERLGPLTRKDMETDVPSLFDKNIDCYNCPISAGCGSCAALCYQESGLPIKKTNFNCQMHTARALANVYYFGKLGKPIPNNVPEDWALQIIDRDELVMLNKLSTKEI